MDDPIAILEQVKPSLVHWDIQPQAIELASHSENIVYKVIDRDGRKYALRVHRPGYHSLDELNSEQRWTQALNEYGIQVPTAYATAKGDYYAVVDCGDGLRQVGLIAWLEGQPLKDLIDASSDDSFPLESLTAIGRLCAQMHNQAVQWCLPQSFPCHHWNLGGLMGENPLWGRFWEAPTLSPGERKKITSLRKAAITRLQIYGQQPSTYSVIHADLHESNILVNDSGLAAIDFDDFGFGWHVYDLAVALFKYSEQKNFGSIQQAIIKGYRQYRELSDEDLSLLPFFIQLRNLALIGWKTARPEVGDSDYLPYLIEKACR